jgi:hypothetical protein
MRPSEDDAAVVNPDSMRPSEDDAAVVNPDSMRPSENDADSSRIGIAPLPSPHPEPSSEEGGYALPELSEDKQLVAAATGAGSTLSLLGLALRRRLTGGI